MECLGSLYGERHALSYALDRLEVYPYLFDNTLVSSCRISYDKYLVAYPELAALEDKLGYTYLTEEVGAFAQIYLHPCSRRAVDTCPLAQTLPEIVAVPETAIEHSGKFRIPHGNLIFRKRALYISIYSVVVSLHNVFYIFGSASPALYLEHPHAGIYHLVQEMNGFKVFGRHYILVVYLQFYIRRRISDRIAPTAYLIAAASVCRAIFLVQAQITLPRDSHTQRSVAKHLYLHQIATASAYLLLFDSSVDMIYLVEVQFACKYHHIGKLGIKLQCLYVRNIELCRQMNLHVAFYGIHHSRHIGGNYSRYACLFDCIDDITHQFRIVVVDDGV